jgi:hypothetical protein
MNVFSCRELRTWMLMLPEKGIGRNGRAEITPEVVQDGRNSNQRYWW